MGLPAPPIATITSKVPDSDDDDNDDDTISILPSQSYDNVIVDLSKASFHEIESRLGSVNAVYGGDTSTINFGGSGSKYSIDSLKEEDNTNNRAANGDTAVDGALDDNDEEDNLTLDERDLNPLLEIMLRGKNDDCDEETMRQSMSIYRKLLKPHYPGGAVSCAATAGGSVGGMTTTTVGIVIHEGMLVYAVRKKYIDRYMMELMNMLFDAIEESNFRTSMVHTSATAAATATNTTSNGSIGGVYGGSGRSMINSAAAAPVDGRRILDLALIYGNVGAARAIIQRYPECLDTRDILRGQLPLHVACHVGMMVEDDYDDYDDGMSVATGTTGRSSIVRRKRRKHRQAELIYLLIKEGVKRNVGGVNGAGGLYEQDELGTTPLMQLIHALNNPFTWDDDGDDGDDDGENNEYGHDHQNEEDKICAFDFDEETIGNTNVAITKGNPHLKKRPLANMEICVKAAWKARGPNNHFPILHEAMNISSPDAFHRILEIVKFYDTDLSGTDKRGRTALVKAIYIDKIIQRRTSTRDVIKMILGGISSECATIRDGAGRLPLHIAAELGLRWDDGLCDIINAHYRGLEEPHSVSGLYPFVLAAQAGPGDKDLTTLYRLIRERPRLLIKAKRVKAKSRIHPKHSFVDFNHQKRPLTPSVHSPLVHIPSGFTTEEGGSQGTIPTIHSSSTIGGIEETIRSQSLEEKVSTNPFED